MLRSDVILERDVAAELAGDGACKMAKIVIAVKNGVVTLTGTLPDRALQMAALRAVKRVFGVEGVDPNFEIAPHSEHPATTTTLRSPGSS